VRPAPALSRQPLTRLPLGGALRTLVRHRLGGFELRPLTDPALRRAAVAVAIAEAGFGADLPDLPQHGAWSRAPSLLLTRRGTRLSRHAGQWALPGGRIDEGETPEQAALRELHEEIGLRLEPIRILGRLDDFATRSGFVITPVVVWAGTARRLKPDGEEVASIHRIPLTEFLRADAPMLEPSRHGPHPVLRLPVGESWIAAPTAAIVYQLREVALLGRTTRVAHFDQPEFAWR